MSVRITTLFQHRFFDQFVRYGLVGMHRIWGMLVRMCAGLAIVLVLGWVIIDLPGAWAALGVLLIGTVLVVRPGVDRRKATVLLLAVSVGITTVDYLIWRLNMISW